MPEPEREPRRAVFRPDHRFPVPNGQPTRVPNSIGIPGQGQRGFGSASNASTERFLTFSASSLACHTNPRRKF